MAQMSNITNHKVIEYINKFYRPLNKELAEIRAYGENTNIPIIMKETESFLNFLLKEKSPDNILEIGTAIGYSAAYFATVCPNAKIVTIEKKDVMAQTAKNNISRLGLDSRIEIKVGDGEEKIKEFFEPVFDFVFIDAAKSHYIRFFEAAVKVCKPGAIIVSDNILQRGMTVSKEYDVHDKHRTNIRHMREYLEFLYQYPNSVTSLLSQGDGLALTFLNK